MNHLEAGGHVLLLANGQKGSFPLADHWFLKGAPYVSGHPLTNVSFEGVADYYELYVNGTRAGSGGNIEKKETAFEERTSHLVTELVTPGETAQIAIRVYDWYGAGGLFRPVTLGTVRIGSGANAKILSDN